jgi:hypothetical protein
LSIGVREVDLEWARDVLERLSSAEAPRERLVSLIGHLDRTIADRYVAESFRSQLLTRAVAAAGRALLACSPVDVLEHTVAAADAYVAAPSEETFAAYYVAATSSYPYGQGDGCYSVVPGLGCGPGSGCRTGAGTLVEVALVIGDDRTLDAIANELAPWLETVCP